MNMNTKKNVKSKIVWFAFIVLMVTVSGCHTQAKVQSPPIASTYMGAMDTDYEDALNPEGQLALGILKLADTSNALNTDQTANLLALWQALHGTVLKGDAEREAVLIQIEAILSDMQMQSIQAMRLTHANAVSWLQTQDNVTGLPGDSDSVSAALIYAVVDMLTDVDGQTEEAVPDTEILSPPKPTPTPTPTLTVEEQPTTINLETTATREVVQAVIMAPESDLDEAEVQFEGLQQDPTTGENTSTPVIHPPPLVQIPDTDPGPPFTVEITSNYAVPNPDLEEGWIYTVGGFVRNESDQTYSLSAVHVTFFDTDGFKGAFYRFPGRRRSGEWIAHGRMQADYACLVLGPGQSCPFSAKIAAHAMASFHVHPDAELLEWREPAPVQLQSISLHESGTGYLRIQGTVHNANPYSIQNVMITAVLLDSTEQWVSFGSMTVLGSIESTSDVAFEVWLEKVPYVEYALYATAERDF